MKYNFIYKTTNLVNYKVYIGVHSTDNLNDGYVGSGTRLLIAIEKYGKENFKTEPIQFFDDINEAYTHESTLVNSEWISRDDTYNIALGGSGGNLGRDVNKKISNTVKQHIKNGLFSDVNYSNVHTEHYKNNPDRKFKLSNSLREYYKNNYRYNKGVSPSNDTKLKLKDRTNQYWINYYNKESLSIIQFSLNGIFIKEWNDINEVCNNLQLKKRTFYSVLNNNNNNFMGFMWKYKSLT